MKFCADAFMASHELPGPLPMELDWSRTSIMTRPRRLAVPVAAMVTLCTLKIFMKYVGAATLASTLISTTPLGLPFSSASWVRFGVTVGVPIELKYPEGKFAAKNWLAVLPALMVACATVLVRFTERPAARAAASAAELKRDLIM